ncbi:MAG: right-handed parallel beta-helix repeat-containing protein, partial [Planctomycetota bacterium]
MPLDRHDSLFVGTSYREVFCCNGETGQRIRFMEAAMGTTGHVLVKISPDGRLLATAWDGEVRLRETGQFKVVAELSGHQLKKAMHSICWDATGRYLATAGVDGTAIIWDIENQRLLHRLYDVEDSPYFSFNQDGSRFLSANADRMRVWETTTGRELFTILRDEDAEIEYDQFVNDTQSDSSAPGDFSALSKYLTLRDFKPQADRLDIERQLLLGAECVVQPNHPNYSPEQAIEVSSRILAVQPELPEAVFLHALGMYRLDKFDECLSTLDGMDLEMSQQAECEFEILRYLCLRRLGRQNAVLGKVRALFESRVWMRPELSDVTHQLFCVLGEVQADGDVIVTTLEDELPRDGKLSLRQALAIVPQGGTIRFNVTGKLKLRMGGLTIDRPVKLIGPGKDKLTIDGRGDTRIIYVNDGDPKKQSEVEIRGLRFTKADAGDERLFAFGKKGGAIRAFEPMLIEECHFEGNHGKAGGAIYTSICERTMIRHCEFSGNSAGQAGAVGASGNGVLEIEACLFESNVASVRDGGAILAAGNQTRLRVSNCTFFRNVGTIHLHTDDNPAGGIRIQACPEAVVNHCTFVENKGNAITCGHYHGRYSETQLSKLKVSNSLFTKSSSSQRFDIWADQDVEATVSYSLITRSGGISVDQATCRSGLVPRLGPLGNNGGITRTISLLPGSPAIDH